MVTGTPDISISSLVFPRTDNERDHFELSTDFYQLVTWLCSSDGVASNGWYNGVVSSTPFKNNFRPNFNKKNPPGYDIPICVRTRTSNENIFRSNKNYVSSSLLSYSRAGIDE